MTNNENDIVRMFYIEQQPKEMQENLYKFQERWIYEAINSWEDFCIDSLYKEYQKYGFTKVFVINCEEFKKFLLWALPEYKRRFKDGK